MKVFITSDTSEKTRVSEAHGNFEDLYVGYRVFFKDKHYGTSLVDLGIIFMCRSPDLNFKRRVRYYKARNELNMDIMCDFYEFINAESDEVRTSKLAKMLLEQVPPVIRKYKLPDFDVDRFETDLHTFFDKFILPAKETSTEQ